MFHRKRHHHTDPAARSDSADNTAAAAAAAQDTTQSPRPSRNRASDQTDFHRHTSPVCVDAVKFASSMMAENGRPITEKHSFRTSHNTPSQSPARSPENVPSSTLTGLFRRKKNPLDNTAAGSVAAAAGVSASTSASFNDKLRAPKPIPPPKPRSLNAAEFKGRSLSPLPSANVLTSMAVLPLQSVVFDVSQLERKSNAYLPVLVLSSERDSSSQPSSPTKSHDLRQNLSTIITFIIFTLL